MFDVPNRSMVQNSILKSTNVYDGGVGLLANAVVVDRERGTVGNGYGLLLGEFPS